MTTPPDPRAGTGRRAGVHDTLEALDVRPLSPVRSFKMKMGVLVVAAVAVSAVLTWLSVTASVAPWIAIPVIVVVCLVVTQVLARGMTRPLRQMTAAARAMARGDYAQRIETTSQDEVGQLAEAFTVMARDLEQTDRMRRDLVANVSHELRTPVAALRGQLENLVDGVVPAEEESLEVALHATERLSDLVDHLLDLSRIDAGVADIDAQSITLTPFLREAVDTAALASDARGRAVRWLIDVQPPDLTAVADPSRLHQVVANLLDNASRHSPSGGRIRVRAGRRTDADGVWIEVDDEGPGIPRDERELVFERFQRGGRADSSGGTGLGLAIARWAVELHGGSIEVLDSERGAGGASSRIRVTLPEVPSTGAEVGAES